MASTSETSFGSRLANAQKIAVHLASFTNYIPASPDCTLANYQALITQITNANSSCISFNTTFMTNVATRQDLFYSGSASMLRRLTPVGAYIRALYGKDAKETELVRSLIVKLRGTNTLKFKRSEAGDWVSQSQRSLGSMAQNFTNLITTLANYGPNYAPSNPLITTAALQQLHTDLLNSTDDVTSAYGQLKLAQDERIDLYQDLQNRSTRIKETIKSIYGGDAPEYKLIKGLRI